MKARTGARRAHYKFIESIEETLIWRFVNTCENNDL